MDLVEAAESGDRRATLEALRDRLAHEITYGDEVKAVAPLANQLRAVLVELESLPGGVSSVVDDLAARRVDRRSAAQGGDVPAGGDIGGS